MNRLFLFVIPIVLSLGCTLGGMTVQLITPTPYPPPAPTMAIAPTPYPLPTSTKVPVPEPTIVPVSTSVPYLETKAGESSYLEGILSGLKLIMDGLQGIQILAGAPNVTDPTWYARMKNAGDDMRKGHAMLEALDPPNKYWTMHQQLLVATGYCSEAADVLDEALLTLDVHKLDRVTVLITLCGDSIPEFPK